MYDAEQLMQDSFLKIFNHMNDYSGKGSFEGWMRRIVVNTCLDYLKSKYLKNSMQLHFPNEIGESATFSISNNALDKIAMKDLLGIIQTLPPMSRTVFNLFVFEGYSHKEIGKLLEMSEGTSQWHVNNARKSLQQKIKANQLTEIKCYEQKRI
jgi:RNA polymerase sigma-70 factor (ECF subfamily)